MFWRKEKDRLDNLDARTEELERKGRHQEHQRCMTFYPLCKKYDLIVAPSWECTNMYPTVDIIKVEKLLIDLTTKSKKGE